MSAAGITSGLAAIRGGTMVGGIVVAAAAAVDCGAYWLWRRLMD
ncbi:MAG: hypothetical protein ACYT04_55520 [Nostoc sp.]